MLKKNIFKTNIKVGFVSLGCDKNRVDLETMIAALVKAGYEISPEAEASVLIINTCAFIQDARKEAVEVILDAINRKLIDPSLKLVVSGCLPELDGLPELKNEKLDITFPEIDLFVKVSEQDKIVLLLDKLCNVQRPVFDEAYYKIGDRYLTTIGSYAYIKIAEGCNNFCSYCRIPFIRGRFVSRKLDDILKEAKQLVQNGVSELILVAQDVTKYGQDLDTNINLITLLKELENIKGLKWIRLLYCYPDLIDDDLINLIAKSDKICKYIDVPMQHVSNHVLKLMHRRVDKAKLIDLIEKLKKNNISIRSTFIVGFPKETRKDFKELKDFIKMYKLENVGFFKFSKEDGTLAAKYKGQKCFLTKNFRVKKINKLQEKVSNFNNLSLINCNFEAVCDNMFESGIYEFRTQYQSPYIDKKILVKTNKNLIIGNYYTIKIIKTIKNCMYAQIKGDNNEFTK